MSTEQPKPKSREEMQALFKQAPPGALEALQALNEELGTDYPLPDKNSSASTAMDNSVPNDQAPTDVDPQGVIPGDSVEVINVEKGLNSQSSLELAPSDDISTETADQANTALAGLTERQQAQLSGISQEIVDAISTGPASIIDQEVIAMLQTLPKKDALTFKEIALSPRAAFKALAANNAEVAARTQLRESVADTALTIAKLAQQDMKRKVFGLFIEKLEETEGPEMDAYCEEHGLTVPEPGTQDRKLILIRMHSENLALAEYKIQLERQWKKFVEEKAHLQASTARAVMRAELLPELIEARAELYPQERKRIFQNVGHYTGIVVGGTGAIIGGTITSFVAGLYYGGEAAWKATGEKIKQIKLPQVGNMFKGRGRRN